MICSNCENYKLLLDLEEYIVSISPSDYKIIDELFENYSIIADDNIKCFECDCEIVKGESYIKDYDNFLESISQYFAEKISDKIDSCEQCGKGAEIKELYYSIESIFYDEDDDPEAIFDDIDTASTIGDIMSDFLGDRCDIWDRYYDDIVEFVQCPHCGNGSGVNYDEKIDYGTFNLYTEVYTKQDIQQFNHNFYGDELEEINDKISDLAEKCSFDELVNLKNQYIDKRLYAAKNHVFDKLEQFIRDQYHSEKSYVLSKNRLVFRTRTSTIGKPLQKEELWEPPFGCAGHGRYNDIGVSILYCANNREVIKKEVALPRNHRYNIAKFIIHKNMKLFPINNIFDGEFAGLIDESVPKEQQSFQFKKQYIISNIVSGICKEVGYDGIVYHSTKDRNSIDYALFCIYKKGVDIEILDIEV